MWEAAAITGISAILSAKFRSRADTQSANIAAGGVTEASRLGAASQAETLKYLKNQALIARADARVDRRGNYLSSEAFEQNLHNRLAASFRHTYAGDLAGRQTDVDMFNASQANAISKFRALRGDENMLLASRHGEMGKLGEMIGSWPVGGRDPLSFEQLREQKFAEAADQGPTVLDPRVKTPWTPWTDPPVNV
jgi:hypothetical protein